MTNLQVALRNFLKKYRAEHPAMLAIDLNSATGSDYALPLLNQRIVLTDNYSTAWDFALPAAVGSGIVISISNQHTASVNVNPDGTDTIDGANTAMAIVTLDTKLFADYAAGKWTTAHGA
jgi:hypothetical protein